MRTGLVDRGRGIDADDAAGPLLSREAGDHASQGRSGDRADDDGVEENPELLLLFFDLSGPIRETEPSQSVVRCSRGNRIRRAARCFDVGDRLLPARLETDAETGRRQSHVGAHQTGEHDIADPVIDRIGPVHPGLLHEDALHSQMSGDGRDLAGVVGLHTADGDECVCALRTGFGHQVLEFADLVAAKCQTTVAVFSLRPDRRPTEMLRQAL